MKKTIILTLLTVAIGATITFYSCKKQETKIEKNEFNVNFKNNRLVFATKADYENVVNDPAPEIKNRFIETISSFEGFISAKEHINVSSKTVIDPTALDTLISDDYFRAMLNSDLIVQIGAYLYRVNPLTEKVYVLAAIYVTDDNPDNEYYDLVNENTKNKHIRVFSTDEDVLAIMENEDCSESGVAGTESHDYFYYNNTGCNPPIHLRFYCKVDFNRYGIYFSLYSEMKCVDNYGHNTNTDMAIEWSRRYKPRCKSEQGWWSGTSSVASDNKVKFQSYSGSTNLHHLQLRATFKHPSVGAQFGTFGTLQILKNY